MNEQSGSTYPDQRAVENRPMMANAEAPRPENSLRRIEITPHGYGFVVVVGCQSFCIETKERLLEKLTSYLFDPAETEKKWFKGELFK